jgi:hypothetical protein
LRRGRVTIAKEAATFVSHIFWITIKTQVAECRRSLPLGLGSRVS